MKRRTKNILRAMAKLIGLKVVFVSYLPDDVYGKLLGREKRILINARKPRYEHTFTMLHEIAHYRLHVQNPNRRHHARFLEINWKIERLLNLCAKLRRAMQRRFAKERGREFEADLWAFCALLHLSKIVGSRDDFMDFLDHHPEKSGVFMLAACGVIYSGIKQRFANYIKILLKPVQAI